MIKFTYTADSQNNKYDNMDIEIKMLSDGANISEVYSVFEIFIKAIGYAPKTNCGESIEEDE